MRLTTLLLLTAFSASILAVSVIPSEAVICARDQKWDAKKKQCVPR